jgi:hypothetical protein
MRGPARRLAWTLVLAFPLLGFVCDQSHAPALQNNLDQPIKIHAAYSNGQSFAQDFPPGARIWAPHEGLVITRLQVAMNGKVLFDLNSQDIERLAAGVAPGQRIVWTIESDGIHPVPLKKD